MAVRDPEPGRYCCLHQDCDHAREHVFGGGAGAPEDDKPESIAKYDTGDHNEPPGVRHVRSSDSAASGDEISG